VIFRELERQIEKFKEHVIIVEGKKDALALKHLGFEKVFEIHKNRTGIRERVEQIAEGMNRKENVCVLTDLDESGRKLNREIKTVLQELGIKVDNRLRGILRREGISHVEGLRVD
jgi:5S rRNA maturation endonuclease (ribonuclease M5)